MTLTPYFAPLAGISPSVTNLGVMVPTPGIMSITNGTEDQIGGGGASQAGTLIRIEDGIVAGEKPPILLVTLMPDDSGSISSYGNAAAIRRGHNEYLDMFAQSPARIMVRTRYLNGEELFPFCQPAKAIRMDSQNYAPNMGTPLYAQTYDVLQEVLGAARVYAERHPDHDIFTMTFVMTDGADTGSDRTPAEVKSVVDRMFASGRHVVAGIGVRDMNTDFPAVFRSMGIPEQWIKVLERNENDIVEGMTHVAKTTHTVSGARSFTQTMVTGFTGMPGQPAAPRVPPAQPTGNPARVVIRPGATAVPPAGVPSVPYVPKQAPATAMPGASAIGNMMGATTRRAPEEVGGVPPMNLPWEPTQMAYYFDEQGAMDAIPSPLQWNPARAFYTAALPDKDVLYIFGRDGGQMQEDVRQRILALLKSRREKNRPVRVLYVPMRDRREPSTLSRFHAILGSLGKNAHSLAAVDGDATIISGDDPATDQYQQGKQGKSTFVNPGDRVKLTPGIVFRVI
jgi:hypothetical protein